MFPNLTDLKKSTLFTVVMFALIAILLLASGNNVSTSLYMLVPTTAALLMMFLFTLDGYRREGWAVLGLHRLGLAGLMPAVVVPTCVLLIGFGVIWLTGIADYVVPDQVMGFSSNLTPLILLVGIIADTLTVSLGEELGWRGYLLPRLLPLGHARALIVSGVIWAAFHFPIMLTTDAYHAGENMWITLPLFVLSATAAGTFIGHLRLKTNSVWPAALAHSTHNAIWAFCGFYTANASATVEYLTGDIGVITLLSYSLIVWWLIKRERRAVITESAAQRQTSRIPE